MRFLTFISIPISRLCFVKFIIRYYIILNYIEFIAVEALLGRLGKYKSDCVNL
jgi:hypothetical protein